VTSVADLLDAVDRRRLAALGSPPGTAELAAAAREAAAGSTGTGRVAWALVGLALERAEDLAGARDELAGMVEDDALRATAIACLNSLTCQEGR
jgi:hypothetical protein